MPLGGAAREVSRNRCQEVVAGSPQGTGDVIGPDVTERRLEAGFGGPARHQEGVQGKEGVFAVWAERLGGGGGRLVHSVGSPLLGGTHCVCEATQPGKGEAWTGRAGAWALGEGSERGDRSGSRQRGVGARPRVRGRSLVGGEWAARRGGLWAEPRTLH